MEFFQQNTTQVTHQTYLQKAQANGSGNSKGTALFTRLWNQGRLHQKSILDRIMTLHQLLPRVFKINFKLLGMALKALQTTSGDKKEKKKKRKKQKQNTRSVEMPGRKDYPK